MEGKHFDASEQTAISVFIDFNCLVMEIGNSKALFYRHPNGVGNYFEEMILGSPIKCGNGTERVITFIRQTVLPRYALKIILRSWVSNNFSQGKIKTHWEVKEVFLGKFENEKDPKIEDPKIISSTEIVWERRKGMRGIGKVMEYCPFMPLKEFVLK